MSDATSHPTEFSLRGKVIVQFGTLRDHVLSEHGRISGIVFNAVTRANANACPSARMPNTDANALTQ